MDDDDVIMSDDDFRRTVLINAPDPEDLEVRMARIKSWKRDRSARARGATKSTSLRELAEQHTKPAVDGTVKLIMERQSEEIRTHGVAHLTRAPAKFERTRDAANRVKQWKTPEDAFAAEQKRLRRQKLSQRETVSLSSGGRPSRSFHRTRCIFFCGGGFVIVILLLFFLFY